MSGDIHEGKFVSKYQVARASAALPAAGAYDAAPLELDCVDASVVRLNFTYTRGAVGGAFATRIETSPDGGTTWFRSAALAAGVVVVGVDTTNIFQRNVVSYQAVGATAENVELEVKLYNTVDAIRVSCAETGVVGTPGTLAIVARFGLG